MSGGRRRAPPCPCGRQHFAKGLCHRCYVRRRYHLHKSRVKTVTARLDPETHAELKRWARKNRSTVKEALVTFITWGLET